MEDANRQIATLSTLLQVADETSKKKVEDVNARNAAEL
jgi:hypothetical protein